MIIHRPPLLVSQPWTLIKQITSNQQTCGSSAFYKDSVPIHFPFELNYFSLPQPQRDSYHRSNMDLQSVNNVSILN